MDYACRGVIASLDNASCIRVLVWLSAADLARSAATSRHWHATVPHVVSTVCTCEYGRKAPLRRPSEPWSAVLRFIEAMASCEAQTKLRAPAVTAGTYHNVMVTPNGQVYAFGDCERGQVR